MKRWPYGLVAGVVASALFAWLLAPAAPEVVLGPGAQAAIDSDSDGLVDLDEVMRLGTDPARDDSDGDGLPDAWEVAHRGPAGSCPDPTVPDADRDCVGKGLALRDDFALHTDPRRADSDGDGIPDAYEASHGMRPDVDDGGIDPFGDGLTNRARFLLGARGDRVDSACSGMPDSRKATLGLDPSRASTGASGVPDGYALHWGLDPRDPAIGDARLDADPAGLTVREKAAASFARLSLCGGALDQLARSLDPRRVDSDGDGLPDSWELDFGLDPVDPADAANPSAGDPEVTNLQAYAADACPDRPDCDADGLTSREEAVGWIVVVDGSERRSTADPLRATSDGDRIPDGAKRAGRWDSPKGPRTFPPLDARTPDTDADGLADADEVVRFPDLLDPARSDSDSDGIRDGEEVAYWDARALADPPRALRLCAACALVEGSPANVGTPDADGDGLLDGEEIRPPARPVAPGAVERAAFPETDPASPDTDGDALPDAWERTFAAIDRATGAWDLDPTQRDSVGTSRGCATGRSCDDGERDLDGDGLSNLLERSDGTDPRDPDTDGDTLSDGWEHEHGAPSGARFGAAASVGAGWTWVPKPGEPSRLSPIDSSDAGASLARFASTYSPPLDWTFADAGRLGASPLEPDSSGDGLPDLWKAWHNERIPGTFRIGAREGDLDFDGDALSNLDEFRLGTDPLDPDTDGGGLLDGRETVLGLDPRSASDDSDDGDADGDGLTNGEERIVWASRPDEFDTDGDGLLDGESLVLAWEDPRADSFRAAGIAWVEAGDLARFLGEREVSADPARGCVRAWSCSGDDLPDSWKVYYGLPALVYNAPDSSRSEDGLGVLLEYRWGRPAEWDEAVHGTWWLGLDPSRADTNGDGVGDDRHVDVGEAADLDRDGLSDLAGEDPWPFYDAANVGAVDTADRGALFAALKAREAARGPVASAPARTTRLVVDQIPTEIEKGASVAISGRLLAEDGGALPAATPVVLSWAISEESPAAALRSGAPDKVIGVGFTDAAGRFDIAGAVMPAHAVDVPAAASALFGRAPDARAEWVLDTAALVPGARVRLVVAAYAREGEPGSRSATFATSPLPVVSTVAFRFDGMPRATRGSDVFLNVTLVDGSGDPVGSLDPALVSCSVDGAVVERIVVEGATARFRISLPPDAGAPLRGEVEHVGDADIRGGNATFEVRPLIPTRLAVAAASEARLGEALAVEGMLVDERGGPVPQAGVRVSLGRIRAGATTGPDGAFATTVEVPAGTGLGTVVVEATYDGDDLRLASSARGGGVTVRAAPEITDLRATIEVGRGGAVEGRLLAVGAAPRVPGRVAPPNVTVDFGTFSASATPHANGSFTIVVPAAASPPAGPIALRIVSDGSPLVLAAARLFTADVRTGIAIDLEGGDALRGESSTVRGRAVDAVGRPVAGLAVSVLRDGIGRAATTLGDGRFEASFEVPASDPAHAVAVVADFPGDRWFEPSHAERVARTRIPLHMEPAGQATAESPVARLRILDDAGAPVPGLVLRVESGDGSVRAVVVDASGIARIPGAHDAARIVARVLFGGNDTFGPLEAAIDEGIVRASRIELASPAAATLGSDVRVVARLLAANGTPIPGRRIEVVWDDASAAGRTDARGDVSLGLGLPWDASPGSRALRASFPGDDEWAPSEAVTSLVARRATRIVVEVADRDGRPVVSARLVDVADRPVPRASLSVLIPGYASPLLAETDESGRIRLDGLPSRRAGEVAVSFAGNATHASSVGAEPLAVASASLVHGGSPLRGFAVFALAAATAEIARRAWRSRGRRSLVEFALCASGREEVALHSAFLRLAAAAGLPATSNTIRDVVAAHVRAGHLTPVEGDGLVRSYEEARYSPRRSMRDDVRAVVAAARAAERRSRR